MYRYYYVVPRCARVSVEEKDNEAAGSLSDLGSVLSWRGFEFLRPHSPFALTSFDIIHLFAYIRRICARARRNVHGGDRVVTDQQLPLLLVKMLCLVLFVFVVLC